MNIITVFPSSAGDFYLLCLAIGCYFAFELVKANDFSLRNIFSISAPLMAARIDLSYSFLLAIISSPVILLYIFTQLEPENMEIMLSNIHKWILWATTIIWFLIYYIMKLVEEREEARLQHKLQHYNTPDATEP